MYTHPPPLFNSFYVYLLLLRIFVIIANSVKINAQVTFICKYEIMFQIIQTKCFIVIHVIYSQLICHTVITAYDLLLCKLTVHRAFSKINHSIAELS